MAQLSSLSPKLIWQFFEQICHPHPPSTEAQLSAWIVAWAQGEGLAVKTRCRRQHHHQKETGHAEDGNHKAVVLQAHIDMVPQANADTQHDFTTRSHRAYIDGE